MLTRLWRNRKMAIAYYAHFHRPFPFDPDSTWVRPVSFIDDLSASGIPALPCGPGSIDDFRRYNVVTYETTYIMRREYFMRCAREFFGVLEYVFQHADPVVPDQVEGVAHQHFRYPGFLGERFLPFFIYANGLRKIELPLVRLEE